MPSLSGLTDTIGKPSRSVRLYYWTTALALGALGLLTANPILTFAAVVIVPLIVDLTWHRGEPPILTFACLMHWVQASAAIFYTNWYHTSLYYAFGGPQLEEATWLSLVGVVALAVGVRVAMVRAPVRSVTVLQEQALSLEPVRIFSVYALACIVSFAFATSAFVLPGITQILLGIAAVRWVFVFLLAASVFEHRRGYDFLIGCIAAELVVGLTGYFSGFKSVFFVVAIAALMSPRALRGTRLAMLAAAAAALMFFATLWTAIKGEYREFLSQGFTSQEIVAPLGERFGKLSDLIFDFRFADLPDAFEALVLRMSYVQYFAHTLNYVPASVPYENGKLWAGALKHIVTPRLLFPKKAIIDDSERASLYTGMQVAGREQGTSIGIGYFAESYVDFGPVWMFMPIFLLGASYGLLYRIYVTRIRYRLLGSAIMAAVLIFGGSAIETSNIKIVGGNVTLLLIMTGLYLFFGRAFMLWATRSGK